MIFFFPTLPQKRPGTINGLKRLNREIRQQTRMVSVLLFWFAQR